jgi:ATP-dependent Lhr-like helicase
VAVRYPDFPLLLGTTRECLRDAFDLREDEIAARAEVDAEPLLAALLAEHHAIRVRIAGEARVAAAEGAARFRDALGAAVPRGLPGAFVEPVADPLADLVARYARTHGPFCAADVAAESPARILLDPDSSFTE